MTNATPSRKLKVGVLRGGPSDEYHVSLKSGSHALDALRSHSNYEVKDIFIDRAGVWHTDGIARPIDRIVPHVDVVVNALHGAYGEDGRVQQILEQHRVPFTGSTTIPAATSLNKPLAKKFFKKHGLMTPEHIVIQKGDSDADYKEAVAAAKEAFAKYPFLRFVKPAASGSALGSKVIHTDDELEAALAEALAYSDSILLEEYLKGREVTCGVIEGSKAGDVSALHPRWVEMGDSRSESISENDIARIQQTAIDAHKALGLRHYSSADFILNRFGLYILEVDALPAFASDTPFSQALSAADISLSEFLEHVITLAVERR